MKVHGKKIFILYVCIQKLGFVLDLQKGVSWMSFKTTFAVILLSQKIDHFLQKQHERWDF